MRRLQCNNIRFVEKKKITHRQEVLSMAVFRTIDSNKIISILSDCSSSYLLIDVLINKYFN